MVIAEDWGLGEVFLVMFYFFALSLWIWLVISVFTDLLRSRDLSGWGKAGWAVVVIILPFLGVFAYLIARGGRLNERAWGEDDDPIPASAPRAAAGAPAAAPSSVDQSATLVTMRDQGVIDQAEFERMKATLIATV